MSGLQVLEAPEVMPGTRFVQGMPEEEYHSHHALSASGMKVLINESPLKFRYSRAQNVAKKEFDVGHAFHAQVLGVGAPIAEIPDRLLSGPHRAIQSGEAKAWVEEARAEGKVPLKPVEFARVRRMTDAVLTHPKAGPLFEAGGHTEASLFATHPDTGVELRSRLDRLTPGLAPIDLKSIRDVKERTVINTVIDYGYDIQAEVYRTMLRLVLGVDPEPMTFVFVEKEPPHEVRVTRLTEAEGWYEAGAAKMHAAMELFAWCQEQGVWPGADDDGEIRDLPMPGWYRAQMTTTEVVGEGW